MFQDEQSCTLVIKRAYADDEGAYTALAVNSMGKAKSTCTVKIESTCEGKATELYDLINCLSASQGKKRKVQKTPVLYSQAMYRLNLFRP